MAHVEPLDCRTVWKSAICVDHAFLNFTCRNVYALGSSWHDKRYRQKRSRRRQYVYVTFANSKQQMLSSKGCITGNANLLKFMDHVPCLSVPVSLGQNQKCLITVNEGSMVLENIPFTVITDIITFRDILWLWFTVWKWMVIVVLVHCLAIFWQSVYLNFVLYVQFWRTLMNKICFNLSVHARIFQI